MRTALRATSFATVGVGYGLSERAKLNLSYTYSDVKLTKRSSWADFGLPPMVGTRAAFLTTQLTVKF